MDVRSSRRKHFLVKLLKSLAFLSRMVECPSVYENCLAQEDGACKGKEKILQTWPDKRLELCIALKMQTTVNTMT